MSTSSQSSILKLAVSSGALSPQLATVLALQRAEEPETVVVLREVTAKDLVHGVKNGHYDLGIALEATTTDRDLNIQPLWCDELALAVPQRSPLLVQAEVSFDALLRYPLIRWCGRASEALNRQVDALFETEPRPAEEVTSFEMLAVLVAAGYGVGISPRSRIMRLRGGGVAMRPLANGPYLVRTQLLQPSWGLTPAAERFAERAAKVTATEPA